MGLKLAWNQEPTELQVTPHTGDIVSKESGKVETIGFGRHLRAYSSNKHRFDLWSSSKKERLYTKMTLNNFIRKKIHV